MTPRRLSMTACGGALDLDGCFGLHPAMAPWPGLAESQRFEGRDLAVTTDFRDVFTEVISRHLAAPPATLSRVFPGFAPSRAPEIIRA